MIWFRQIVKFILLFLLQMFVFNNLHWLGICHPFIYVLFLVSMPLLPRWAEMLVGAAVGILMDMVCSSPGVHFASCVAITYLRPLLLGKLVQDVQRITGEVTHLSIGVSEFIRLCSILVVVHHTLVFLLESWTWHNIWFMLLCVIVSAAITLLLIILYDMLRK